MNDNSTGVSHRGDEALYRPWYCSPFGATVWGGILLAVGVGLLLQRLNWIPGAWLQFLWPLLLLALGISCLLWAVRSRRAD